MWRVLQIVHGSKATILGAEAYIKRVRQIEKQKIKNQGGKGMMMKGMSQVISQVGLGSMGNSSAANNLISGQTNKDIKDPLLLDIDKYMTELVGKITSNGTA